MNLTASSVRSPSDKKGDDWKCYWKTEHIHGWTLLTTVNFAVTDHEVGMGVKTFDLDPPYGPAGPAKACFDFFLIGL